MVHFSAFFILASVGGIYASPLEQRASGVPGVLTDISTIGTQLTSLNTSISSLSNTNPSLITGLGIHTAAGTLITAINTGATDVTNTAQPFSEADGNSILTAVQGIQPTIIQTLSGIVAKHPAFVILDKGFAGILKLVHNDLVSLNSSTTLFSTALLNAAPSDLKSEATSIKSAIDAAFSAALAVYP